MRADFSIASILALASSAAAATIRVDVGAAGLVFSPNVTTAQSGDVLEFHFYPRLHNVVQGDPSKPCQPLSGGFYSGFVPSSSGEAVRILAPMSWLSSYPKLTSHQSYPQPLPTRSNSGHPRK
jgi:hypothetical protein